MIAVYILALAIVAIVSEFNGANQVGNVYVSWWNEVIVATMCAVCCGFVSLTIYHMRNLIYLKSSVKTGRGLWIFIAFYTLQAVALIALASFQITLFKCIAGVSTFATNCFLAERLVFLVRPCLKTKCPVTEGNDLDIATRIRVD